MKRTQLINGLEFTIEALSECLMQVTHGEQSGWFGVNLDENSEETPFAWTTDPDIITLDGLLGASSVNDPSKALEELAETLVQMQAEFDAARAQDPVNRLGAFLESLTETAAPETAESETAETETAEQDRTGLGRLRGAGLSWAKRGREALGEKTSQARETLGEKTSQAREALGEKVSQSKDAFQDRIAKVNLPEKRRALADSFSLSHDCEVKGHVFDETMIIGHSENVPRFCRRCRRVIRVNDQEGQEGTEAGG